MQTHCLNHLIFNAYYRLYPCIGPAVQVAFTIVALILAALPFVKNTAMATRAVAYLDSLRSRLVFWWNSRPDDVRREFDDIGNSSSSGRRHAVPGMEESGVEMSVPAARRADASLRAASRANANAEADDADASFPPSANEYLASALALPSIIAMPSAPPLPEGVDLSSSAPVGSSMSPTALPPSLVSGAYDDVSGDHSGHGHENASNDARDEDDEHADDSDDGSDADGDTALARRAVASSVDARSEV